MSVSNEIKVNIRSDVGTSSSRRARRDGYIPAIVYGLGKEPKKLMVGQKDWEVLTKREVHIVKLKSEAGEDIDALIKDVQFDYLSGKTKHIDFLEINMQALITAKLPIHVHGTPIGLSKGGVLSQYLYEIAVTCLPADLPESIIVDVSAIDLNGTMFVRDLKLDDKLKVAEDEGTALFHVGLPKAEEEKKPEAGEAVPAEGEAAAEGGAAAAEGADEKAGDKKAEAKPGDKKAEGKADSKAPADKKAEKK